MWTSATRSRKGDTLATLFVPELVEDFGTKKATVELDKQRIELAKKVVKVAEADVKSAQAALAEAKAILDKFEAMVERWDSEVKRLQNEVNRGVVDPQVLLESTNQLKSSTAAREAAKATIAKAEADLLSRQAVAGQGQGRRPGRPRRLVRGRERGEADRGLGGLPQAPRPLRRRDRGPQCQHLRLRPAVHGRSHGHGALAPPVARRRRADLRGRPHRHRPHLRRHPRARRQLRPHRHQGDRARQGLPRRADPGHRHPHVVGA